jgi:hypothetical protein
VLGMRGMASTVPEGWSVLVGMPTMVSAVSGTLDVVESPPRLHVRAGTRSDVGGTSTGTVCLPISVERPVHHRMPLLHWLMPFRLPSVGWVVLYRLRLNPGLAAKAVAPICVFSV